MEPFAVRIERATVYRSGSGRRRFGLESAVRGDCYHRLRARGYDGSRPQWTCACEPADWETGDSGIHCDVHDRAEAVVARYLRIYGRRIRAEARRQLELAGWQP